MRAAIAIACSWVMFAAVAVMMTSAPRPPVSSITRSTTSTSAPLTTSSGCTASADIFSRSALTSTSTTFPTLWTPRAMRMCMQPIGPAPKTTRVSPSSMPSSSWALIAQANGSAAEASS